ncbi:MAG: AI-2E family transporter [Ruminococcaceae bacterium]|nr:AI-2E family transporter [Oscillospiraceae bacterium]
MNSSPLWSHWMIPTPRCGCNTLSAPISTADQPRIYAIISKHPVSRRNIDMHTNPEQKAYGKWILGIISAGILIYLGVQNIDTVAVAIAWLFNLFSPILLGIAFALIVNVPMRFIETRLYPKTQKPIAVKIRRPIAIVLAYLFIAAILACVFGLVIPALVNAVRILADGAANVVKDFSAMSAEDLENHPIAKFVLNIDWQKPLQSILTFFETRGSSIMNVALSTVKEVFGGVINIFVAIIFSVYVLFHKSTLKRQTRRLIDVWLPKKVGEAIVHTASVAGEVFRNFVAGQTLESVILGVLCIIGMLILQLPYAPMIGALISVTALIPIAGPIIGTAIGAFMIVIVSPIKAVIFVVFMLVLQQLEGNLIYPKVMGSTVNLPAMWVLAAVTIGGGLAGAVGMLLGVPVVSTLYILLQEATGKREKEQENASSPTDTSE